MKTHGVTYIGDNPSTTFRGPALIGIDWAKPETRKDKALQRKISRKLKKRNKNVLAYWKAEK